MKRGRRLCLLMAVGWLLGVAPIAAAQNRPPSSPPPAQPAPPVDSLMELRIEGEFKDPAQKNVNLLVARDVLGIFERKFTATPPLGRKPIVIMAPVGDKVGLDAEALDKEYRLYVPQVGTGYAASFAYNLSLYLAQVWSGPRQSSAFLDSVRIAMALEAQAQMTEKWKVSSPFANGKEFAPAFVLEPDTNVLKPALGRLQIDGPDAAGEWVKTQLAGRVRETMGDLPPDERVACAVVLAQILSDHPDRWGAVTQLGAATQDPEFSQTDFAKWRDLVAPDQRPLVEAIAARFAEPMTFYKPAAAVAPPAIKSPLRVVGKLPHEEVRVDNYMACRDIVRFFETRVADAPALGRKPISVSPAVALIVGQVPSASVDVKALPDHYVVYVTTLGSTRYGTLVYEGGQQIAHVWIGPRASNAFVDSMCAALSLAAMDDLAQRWRKNAPTQALASQATALLRYRDETLLKAAMDHLRIPGGDPTRVKDWIHYKLAEVHHKNVGVLAQDEKIACAIVMLQILGQHPKAWGALTKLGEASEGTDDRTDFFKWCDLVPADQKPLVQELALVFAKPMEMDKPLPKGK